MEVDYVAYMSSIEHLQKTFTAVLRGPMRVWMEDALLDMQTEERRFQQRKSFAYAVLTPDGETELGCVYVYPSKKAGFDAVIRMGVTQEQYDSSTPPCTIGLSVGSIRRGLLSPRPIRAEPFKERLGVCSCTG